MLPQWRIFIPCNDSLLEETLGQRQWKTVQLKAAMMKKIWRHTNPFQDHIPPLCVCFCEDPHAQARNTYVTRSMRLLPLRARSSEPVSCSSSFQAEQSTTPTDSSRAWIKRAIPALLWATISHIGFVLKVVTYINVSEASDFVPVKLFYHTVLRLPPPNEAWVAECKLSSFLCCSAFN